MWRWKVTQMWWHWWNWSTMSGMEIQCCSYTGRFANTNVHRKKLSVESHREYVPTQENLLLIIVDLMEIWRTNHGRELYPPSKMPFFIINCSFPFLNAFFLLVLFFPHLLVNLLYNFILLQWGTKYRQPPLPPPLFPYSSTCELLFLNRLYIQDYQLWIMNFILCSRRSCTIPPLPKKAARPSSI